MDSDKEFSYNGVTDAFLIQLYEELGSYSDWIDSKMLYIDEDISQDVFHFGFIDIDQTRYDCKIYSNHTFEISSYFEELEIWEPLGYDESVLSNCNNLIDYLKNMPKTVLSMLKARN